MKRSISVLLACALMFLACGSTALAATDQPSTWAVDGVTKAKELNLVTDEMNRNFQSPTTRAEFCRLIVNMLIIWYDAPIDFQIGALGLTPGDFNDLTGVDWPYAIRAAAALGITNGTGNGNFSPDAVLTREQAATMLKNTLNVFGIDTANPQSAQWADAGEISTWAREATDVMYAAKIMNGTNANPLTFSPKSHYTHEQAIMTVLNLWEYATSQNVSRTLPESNIDYGKPTTPPPTTSPSAPSTPTSPPLQPGRQFDMNDLNVQKHPIYATAKTIAELRVGAPRWRSAAETIATQKNDDPDYTIDGQTFYDWRMKPIQEWVDSYIASNSLSYKNKTDYEKTAIIRHVIENGRFEEFIGLWRPGFVFTSGDCVPRAEAVDFLMIAMDFQLFAGIHCTWGVAHATNAYWDSTVGAVRFVDAESASSWNCFVDELDEWNFILD